MAGLNKEIEQLELQIKFLEIEIQKANTVNIDLQKQLTLGSVVVSEAELCGCGSELKVINDEDYCPNVDCFKHG